MSGFMFDLSCRWCGSEVVWHGQQSGCATERVVIVVCSNGRCARQQYVSVILRPVLT